MRVFVWNACSCALLGLHLFCGAIAATEQKKRARRARCARSAHAAPRSSHSHSGGLLHSLHPLLRLLTSSLTSGTDHALPASRGRSNVGSTIIARHAAHTACCAVHNPPSCMLHALVAGQYITPSSFTNLGRDYPLLTAAAAAVQVRAPPPRRPSAGPQTFAAAAAAGGAGASPAAARSWRPGC